MHSVSNYYLVHKCNVDCTVKTNQLTEEMMLSKCNVLLGNVYVYVTCTTLFNVVPEEVHCFMATALHDGDSTARHPNTPPEFLCLGPCE